MAARTRLGQVAASDPTPTVRIKAVEAIATIADDLALQVLESALDDSTDTSEAARRGYMASADDGLAPERGVAEAARAALQPVERWPERLRDHARALAARFDERSAGCAQ